MRCAESKRWRDLLRAARLRTRAGGRISSRTSCDSCIMYDLHNLGWNSFQQLCLTITREILGQTVESFLDSNDGGRDGAFSGHWTPTGREDLSGQFVIQC